MVEGRAHHRGYQAVVLCRVRAAVAVAVAGPVVGSSSRRSRSSSTISAPRFPPPDTRERADSGNDNGEGQIEKEEVEEVVVGGEWFGFDFEV